jgi:signal transduction histidine kinase
LMHFLVNDLIDLFRIRNGKFTAVESRVDLKFHLTELIEVFELQAQEKGLGISLEHDPGVPKEVTVDIQRVK